MLKIKRLNANGNEMECLVKVEEISYVTEKEIEDEPLFDGEGNQVDTKHNENVYIVFLGNYERIVVPKATYDTLVPLLTK